MSYDNKKISDKNIKKSEKNVKWRVTGVRGRGKNCLDDQYSKPFDVEEERDIIKKYFTNKFEEY